MNELILISIITILFAEINSWVDFVEIVLFRRSPNHFMRACYRFNFLVLITFALVDWRLELVLLAYSCALFWFYFDIRLSIRRGLDPFYIGKTAWTDRTATKLKIGATEFFFFKLTLMALLATVYLTQKEICQLLNN